MTTDPAAIALLLGLFALMVVLRVPIAFSLALSAYAAAAYMGISLGAIAQQLVKGLNSFSLLAIPFFILAGEIMGEGGISDRLIKFSDVLIGQTRGGLAMVNILASMFFGGISGSAIADTSSIGAMLIPVMIKQGYDADYSVDVTISSACQGILIPPSHNMIIYAAAVGGLSVGKLFMAGLVPGIVLGVALMILSYAIAVKRNYPRGKKYTFQEARKIAIDSIFGLMTAVIIILGVFTGVFTATESAAAACLWAFFVTFFIYREVPLSRMWVILKKTLRTLAMVMSVIAASQAFGYMMTTLRIPSMLSNFLLTLTSNKVTLLLLINATLLLLGCVMDMAPLILITAPILLPVVTSPTIGMDPIQFGIVMMLNLSIGLLTPPVGTVLFVGASIGGLPIEKVAKSMRPFYVTMVAVLLLLTFVPALSMTVPNLMFGN
ncbi:MAG: TRAP transporter large permease [Synergistaceae bacterium]|jgi:tripartite ATP-independent transporter DctM subunit|nr:TRAP transporter large permease [Synergistaceae bacterium]